MATSVPAPRVGRRGVLIPSAWQALALAVVRDPRASSEARTLAELVLEAADG